MAFDDRHSVDSVGELIQVPILLGNSPIQLPVVDPKILDLIQYELVFGIQVAGLFGQGFDLALRGARLRIDAIGNSKNVVQGRPAGSCADDTPESGCQNRGASQNTVSLHSFSYAMSG